jgi:hypothetical protein
VYITLCRNFQGQHYVTNKTEPKVSKRGFTPYDVHTEFQSVPIIATNRSYGHATRQISLEEDFPSPLRKQIKALLMAVGKFCWYLPDNVTVTQNYELNCEKTHILLLY